LPPVCPSSKSTGWRSEIRLGGVASEVIHNAKRPVLLAHLKITDAKDQVRCEAICGNMMEHILYPTDFSDNAENAFAYVKELAQSAAKRVTLLHVQDKVRIGKHLEHRLEEFNRIDRERLERMKSALTQSGGAEVETAIVYGMPVSEILKKVRENGVTLIVMGSQGRGYISELFLGSVSHNVARHSGASVLLVPALRKRT
jgi:nucleotide-binding universal stress UspA family protein